MWDFLFGYLVGQATGVSRIIRPILLVLLIGAICAGIIYACVVFHAISERSATPHVIPHSSH